MENNRLRVGKTLEDGQACGHPGCLSHISHPCEGCGRLGGRGQSPIEGAVEFARKHGMSVENVGDRRLKVTYPSGEHRVLELDNLDTPRIIIDMTCNLL